MGQNEKNSGMLDLVVDPETGEKIPQQELNKRQAERARVKELRAQGLNPDGSPIRPEYQTLLDPATGMLKEQYLLNLSGIDPTQLEGYSKYKQEALRTGPSSWLNLALQKQQAEEAAQRGAAARQSLSSAAMARSQLAMRGGLGVGSRERIARGSGLDLMRARQNVLQQGGINRLGLQTEDERNRIAQLQNLMGSEVDLGKFNKTLEGKQKEFNIMKALEEKRAKDVQDLSVYQEQMKKWAAERQAQATERSGGGGGGGK